MENNFKMSPDMWTPLEKSEKDAEGVSRQSLTFWQDAARRLKQNKVAMISLVIVAIMILACAFVPMFYPITYEDQVLDFSNIGIMLDIYEVDGNYFYMNGEYYLLDITKDGELLQKHPLVKDDVQNKRYIYDFSGKEVIVDYSPYFNAKVEYNSLEKKARKDPTIDLTEAKFNLDNAKRVELTVEGTEIKPVDTVHNKTYIFGTDNLGRDMFIRILHGGRISFIVGFVAAFVNFIIGVLYGGISGYIGGRTDNLMMRVVDVINAIPTLLYVILLMVIMGSGMTPIIVTLSITYWLSMARLVRGQVLGLKEQEFVLAAQSLGASTNRIMLRHLIPNMMGPIMVSVTMQIPNAIFTEAFLSFVGLGVSAPQASWGSLCNDALLTYMTYPYQLFLPAFAISITILAFNLFSDGLRDALDPKQRK
ncbi:MULTISPECIES: ABC transporter permease [unclassified Sedimentibacter]|uniref:ABC transporter permease n=1 Tax=unclassified Sedimentibacter TaxID=2649220 RepID=UPI0027DFB63A|nr:ABC transporter permease [Sedimentibacter sp. MB35-C1]WMJ75786.1 ABC transporter permease [Sedimentibacter sp. MB35-C1]